MYSIKDSNPRKVHLGNTIQKAILDQWQEQYAKHDLTAEGLFWNYHTMAFDGLEYPPKLSEEGIWKKFTKVQKVVIVMAHFIGQVDNGGVWQFFYNQPQYAYAAYEALREINVWVLETRYEQCLKEFGKMIDSQEYQQLMHLIQEVEVTEEKRWELYQKGSEYIPSAKELEEYFYTPDKKDYFYQKLVKYIHLHTSKLFHVEVEKEANAPEPIPRKKAVEHFAEYLTHTYHVAPEEVSIYYTGRVTIENQGTQLFLMYYKMPDGWESIGITGYFTHHFENISLQEINQMYKKYHKQELVNIYHGWYLVNKALLKDPTIFEVDAAEWQTAIKTLQKPGDGQVPVNVHLVQGLRFGGEQWYLYEGDLYYHRKEKELPEGYPNAVNMEQVAGEKNLLFSVRASDLPDFGGRMARHKPVTSKLRVYDIVGSKYKLLKDNAWGF